ncbi:ChuX/HutX family heme-like substrate-binding protein [Azospirillum agricola]|uniref:ChuX/HutX family heme-like substrate-binding protein n=1 Tax=Azospirillum agricola TaxID=1720247 RepID=UPI000A0F2150|nr:ChuX/HutX family heme-like substrate-binding protein [Azospirillum agricola]SMH39974.1 putative hemin transport protein [Azospirillum lipoferum]
MPDTRPTPAPSATDYVRLAVDWSEALPRLEALGPVRVVTTNAAMVHEKQGTFGNVSVMGHAIIVLNRDIDLRVFPRHWEQTVHDVAADAIRVHDRLGRPVHAIHRTAGTDADAWNAFLAEHRAAEQGPLATGGEPAAVPASGAAPEVAPEVASGATDDAAIDVPGLRSAWAAMTDVHEFHGMLKRFGAGRLQAMRLAGGEFARELPLTAVAELLDAARDRKLDIMVFAGNAGCIQIHTGTVANLVGEGNELRIEDPNFRLRCDLTRLASAWVVHKPTDKGGITTVELYDDRGDNAAILCGQRDEDKPERAEWRALARSLPAVAAAA